MRVRPLVPRDLPAVLDLIQADALPGQPRCDLSRLADALAGHASIDQSFWQGMALSTIVVTHDRHLVGVAGYGMKDQDGYLIWLHAHEDKAVIQVLLQAILRELHACQRILAFWFSTPLTLGVEDQPSSGDTSGSLRSWLCWRGLLALHGRETSTARR